MARYVLRLGATQYRPPLASCGPAWLWGIELRIFNGGCRWLLLPDAEIEVWSGLRLVGTMSGKAVTQIVEHHLATAALMAALKEELDQPPLILAPSRKPLAAMAEQRAALRAQRKLARKSRRKA